MIFAGRDFQKERQQILRKKIADLEVNKKKTLSLASFYFSNDPASRVYTRLKEKMAQRLGIKFIQFGIKTSSEAELNQISELIKLESAKVNGILVQKPQVITLPERDMGSRSGSVMGKRDEVFYRLVAAIPLDKDVDVVSPLSLGRLMMVNDPLRFLWPATVRAIFWVLSQALGIYQSKFDDPFELMYQAKVLKNKKIVIVGNRGTVGSLVGLALASFGAQVIGGDRGVEIKSLIQEGEIIISSTGVPGLIKSEWLKPNQSLIDVGFGRKEGKLKGDFEPDSYSQVKFASPVPGGVGPVTVISLMENLVQLGA